LEENPLENILKTRLRPIQERVASLRTQTRIYEQMQRIPGGPTQFISSTLKELEEIYYEKIRALDDEVIIFGYIYTGSLMLNVLKLTLICLLKVLATAVARSIRLNLIPETINEVTKSGTRRLEDIASGPFKFLLIEGVKLVPDNADMTSLNELEYLEKRIGNITLEQINDKLRSLARLYKQRENLIGQVSTNLAKSDICGFKSLFIYTVLLIADNRYIRRRNRPD